jgi:hypothetical protein
MKTTRKNKIQPQMKQSKKNSEEKQRHICFPLGFGEWGVDLFIWERGPNYQFIEGGTMS